MRFPLVALLAFLPGCGFYTIIASTVSEQEPRPTEKVKCYDIASSQVCVPSIGQGYRVFAALPDSGLNGLASYLQEQTHHPVSSDLLPTVTAEFSKAEEDVRAAFPEKNIYDLTGAMPDFVQQKFNRFANFSGPNCYATALVASGVIPSEKMLHVGLDEFQEYLTQYFEEVRTPAFGDVILYDVQGSKDHAAFYLFNDLVFHKKGFLKGYGYRITTLEGVFAADPFEWRPGRFDDLQSTPNPDFGKKPKKFFRRLAADRLPTAGTLTAQEKQAVELIAFIRAETLKSAPEWDVSDNMGTMIESVVSDLRRQLDWLKKSPNFTARIAYEELRSLESQLFQSIEEELFSSQTANAEKINAEHCLPENAFVNELVKKSFALMKNREATQDEVTAILGQMAAVDRKSCRIELSKMIQP